LEQPHQLHEGRITPFPEIASGEEVSKKKRTFAQATFEKLRLGTTLQE